MTKRTRTEFMAILLIVVLLVVAALINYNGRSRINLPDASYWLTVTAVHPDFATWEAEFDRLAKTPIPGVGE
jgi:hypothetical protein